MPFVSKMYHSFSQDSHVWRWGQEVSVWRSTSENCRVSFERSRPLPNCSDQIEGEGRVTSSIIMGTLEVKLFLQNECPLPSTWLASYDGGTALTQYTSNEARQRQCLLASSPQCRYKVKTGQEYQFYGVILVMYIVYVQFMVHIIILWVW